MRAIFTYFIVVLSLIVTAPAVMYKYFKYRNNQVEKDHLKIYKMTNRVFRTGLWAAGTKHEIVGLNNLDYLENGFLVVSNHQSYFDIPSLSVALADYGVSFIAKDSIKKVPIIYHYMCVMDCLFLNRESAKSGMQMIKDGNKLLKSGVNLSIFPEGTRSKDGRVSDFKAGSLKIATRINAPIVPISISHSHDVNPSSSVIRKGTIKILIHQPILSEDYQDLSAQELCDKLEDLIKSGVEI